jgi:glycosyltransferase involved in cell wall biosynthesis
MLVPKVSVVIPIFNAEQYLSQCITSLINQTLEDIEIILVNDGSTDGSLKICEQFEKKDERIKLINKVNSGPSSSRNLGIDKATSEFIAFVDSDDWVENNMFEIMYNAASNNNVDLVLCGMIKETSTKIKSPLKIEEGIHRNMRDFHTDFIFSKLKTLPVAPHCKLYRKKIINNKRSQIRFKPDLFFGEDFVFNLEYILNCSSVYSLSSKCLYHYRIIPTSLTNKYRKNWWEVKSKSYSYLYDILKNYNRLDLLDTLNAKFIIYAITAFTNEAKYKNYSEAVSELNYVCNDTVLQQCLKRNSINKLSIKMKLFAVLIKCRRIRVAYFIANKVILLKKTF